jgi:hypothetical protein
MVFSAKSALGDHVAYRDARTIAAQYGGVRCTHRHDWSAATLASRMRMMMGHHDPFRDNNDYASLECFKESTNTRLFRMAVPALTVVWISNDGQYVVGLSDLKLLNPYQVVRLRRAHRRRHLQSLVEAAERASPSVQTGDAGQ